MPKEILWKIINERLYLEAALIISIYLLVEFTFLKLALKLTNVQMTLKKMLPFIFICFVYNVVGRQFIPNPFYPLLSMLLITLLVMFMGKIPLGKALLATVGVFLLSILGQIVILQPFYLYDKHFLAFIIKTPIKLAVGALSEAVVPALVLLAFPLPDYSFRTFKDLSSQIAFWRKVIITIAFLAVYYLIILGSWFYKKMSSNTSITLMVIEIIILALVGLMFVCTSQRFQKKQLEETQLETQMKHSYRLIQTLLGERREYQDQLQIMNMMANTFNNSAIKKYSSRIIDNMAMSTIHNINNPILASVIVSRQAQAREKDVAIVVQCNSPLQDLPLNPVKLGEIFKILLDMLLETELSSMNETKMIFVYIHLNDHEYFLEFKNSEAAISNFKNLVERPKSPLQFESNVMKQLDSVIDLIKEIGGKPSFTIENNHLVKMQFSIKNYKHKVPLG